MATAIKPRVKICCISNIEEAALAVRYGASAVGLVSEMPSGPGPIPEELIAEIASVIPPSAATFLLTSKKDPASIIAQQRRCKVNTIQICDYPVPGCHDDLHNALPGVKIVQVIHVYDAESVERAVSVAPSVDGLLLDSGNPNSPLKKLGGTGRTHDWRLSKKICDSVEVPVWLAGGLKPENVSDAIRAVIPFAVDVCTGVRTDDKLDEEKLSRFFEAVNKF